MAEASLALVTGAAGFLGRPLCGLLQERGYQVLAVDQCPAVGPWHELRQVDLTNPGVLADLCDGVDLIRGALGLRPQRLRKAARVGGLRLGCHLSRTWVQSQTYPGPGIVRNGTVIPFPSPSPGPRIGPSWPSLEHSGNRPSSRKCQPHPRRGDHRTRQLASGKLDCPAPIACGSRTTRTFHRA